MNFEKDNYELMLIKKLTKKENRINIVKACMGGFALAIAGWAFMVFTMNLILWLGK